jgi:serine phosphatase RsbU (regulator of sigma subunit)
MTAALDNLAEQYRSALVDYLERPGEDALERAYQLGRRVVASEMGILEVAASHQEVLENLLGRSLSGQDRCLLAKSTDFLLQCLSPFEMAHRGVKESNVTLHRLHHTLEQHILEQQRVHQEMEFAQQVQRTFLPASPPLLAGYSFYQHYQPARAVGGDYFDYMHLPGNRLAVTIGDVTGKGVPAALMMARVLTEQRYCLIAERNTSEALTRLNRTLTEYAPEDCFVTCIIMVLELETHRVTVANAGHPPPILRRKTCPHPELVGTEEAAFPLGVAPSLAYAQTELDILPGDTLLIFTDGLTEAQNPAGELYKLQRLLTLVCQAPSQPDAVLRTVLHDLKMFAEKGNVADDLTLICFGREG